MVGWGHAAPVMHGDFKSANKIVRRRMGAGQLIGLYSLHMIPSAAMSASYQPIANENAAAILSVSKRTIDYWIADRTPPGPTASGRRVYWHPIAFFDWLDRRFGVEQCAPRSGPQDAKHRGRPRSKRIQP